MSNLQKISLLTFIKKISTDRGLFQCQCGNTIETRISSVKNLHTCSCGCIALARSKTISTQHGLSYHPLASIRDAIKRRCNNPKQPFYADYGGRGISICKEWGDSYEAFIKWSLANGWQKGLEIDRINNDGNYCPGNCRFVTKKVNANNKRNNIVIAYKGEIKTLKQWCETLNLKYGKIKPRIRKHNWSIEKAFETP